MIRLNRILRLRLQELKSPERMERLGREVFNLRRPKKGEIFILR